MEFIDRRCSGPSAEGTIGKCRRSELMGFELCRTSRMRLPPLKLHLSDKLCDNNRLSYAIWIFIRILDACNGPKLDHRTVGVSFFSWAMPYIVCSMSTWNNTITFCVCASFRKALLNWANNKWIEKLETKTITPHEKVVWPAIAHTHIFHHVDS